MGIELLALILILLAKAQKSFASPTAAASDAQQKANQAAADAQTAAQQGDAATAAQKQAEAQQHQAQASAAAQAARTPPPWPQVVPTGLPPYPGPLWHAASPVTAAMAGRAWQLLPELWAHGEGTWKLEKTGTDWVVYKAAYTSPGKRGVVALTPPVGMQFAPAPAAAPGPTAAAPVVPAPGAPPPGAPAQVVPASTSQLSQAGVQTLRLTSPRMTGPTVVWLQQQLGIAPDGVFGPGTMAAVQHYQSSHGLTPDGVVGPKTWASLGVGQRAAA